MLPFGEAEAKRAAKVRHTLERAGNVIGPFDLLIAGHARAARLVLVSNNTREFFRVDGLTVDDWLQP